MRRPPILFALLSAILPGCAAVVQSPSPARYLDVRGLDQPRPCEHFYVLVFSSEDGPIRARRTHTWLTTVRVLGRGPGTSPAIEHHTISWMPATLELQPLRFYAEPGVNLGLHDTITKVALAQDEQIALWGPYACRESLFARSVIQKQFMESGRMRYQCVDTVGEAARTGDASNCIHAITDMDPGFGRRQYVPTRYGHAAGLEITRRLRELGALVDPQRTHDYLLPALNLDRYPILRPQDDIFVPSRAAPLAGFERPAPTWKVRMIEEGFKRLMFDVQEV